MGQHWCLWTILVLVPLVSASNWRNPYVVENEADFWTDIQLVHKASKKMLVPRFHGASRPFFESITNALSDAEKAAFGRLSQGLMPESLMSIEDDVPANIPIYMKDCESSELDSTTSLMQLGAVNVSLDPRHIKMKVDFQATLAQTLSPNLTHHTVVTVDGVSFGGFQMSPMVLYDKTGPICELFDNVLGCPLNQGEVHISRKIKIPGLDAVTSLPKRLYNAELKLYDGPTFVTCTHLLLDMRSDEERAASPLTEVRVINPVDSEPKNEKLAAQTAVQQYQAVVSTSASVNSTQAEANQATPIAQVDAQQSTTQPEATAQSTTETQPVAQDGGSASLNLLRSMINLQKEMPSVISPKSIPNTQQQQQQQQQDTVLLQQLQLKNLQEQLQKQLELNRKQQEEYEQLKSKLQMLEPSEIDKLKSTVNQLLQVQHEKQEEIVKQQRDAQKERELFQQLQSMYQTYKLPGLSLTGLGLDGMNSPFGFAPIPQIPTKMNTLNLMPRIDRLNDIQFLAQVDTVLQPPAEAKPVDAPTDEANRMMNSVNLMNEPQQQPPAQVAGEYADKAEPLQLPNPKDPTLTYGAKAPESSQPAVEEKKVEEPAEVPSESAEATTPTELPEKAKVNMAQVDTDLPDVSNVMASQPKFADRDYGVSFILDKLDDYVRELCVPFVTLASDLSFAFCVPETWTGLTAIVVTEPFTAEKGIFADKASLTAPHQILNPKDVDESKYYATPTQVGMNELLLKHNYATIIVAFNADRFVEQVAFFTTEIMGAYAAFVDYAGEPTMTIATGVGWGGVLAAQLLERHGGCRLHGGLVIDSPLGNARWQGDYYGDLLALFEWVSPKAYDTIMAMPFNAVSHLLLESWEEIGRPYIYQALTPVMGSTPSSQNMVDNDLEAPRDLKMIEMLRALEIKCSYRVRDDGYDDPHPQCLYDEVANAIRKAAMYVNSFKLAFDGQDPIDNYRTLYRPEMFVHLNDEVQRKMADEAPLNHQTRYLETSGLLRVPLSVMSTRRDPEVPEWQTVEYLRKQKRMCQSNGIGNLVFNDTTSYFFGHAHTDQYGRELSEQLDILFSMINTTRITDDTSLSQRSWIDAPMKMVDPALATCPFQGFWYRDMVSNLKRSIKSGTLRSNKKIKELIDGLGPKSAAPEIPVVSDSMKALNGVTGTATNTANQYASSIYSSPTYAAGIMQNSGFTPQAAGNAAGFAGNTVASGATAVTGTASSVASGAVGAVSSAIPKNNLIQQPKSKKEAIFGVQSPPTEDSTPQEPAQPVQQPSWSEVFFSPFNDLMPRLTAPNVRKHSTKKNPYSTVWGLASKLSSSHGLRDAWNSGSHLAKASAPQSADNNKVVGADVQPISLLQLSELLQELNTNSDEVEQKLDIENQIQTDQTQGVLASSAPSIQPQLQTQQSLSGSTNAASNAGNWQAVVTGMESAINLLNKARHSKLPNSVFKPSAILFSPIDDSSNISIVDKIGMAVEKKVEQQLGLIPKDPPPAPPVDTSINIFPVGRAYSAAMEEKKKVLSQLKASPASRQSVPEVQQAPMHQAPNVPAMSIPQPTQPNYPVLKVPTNNAPSVNGINQPGVIQNPFSQPLVSSANQAIPPSQPLVMQPIHVAPLIATGSSQSQQPQPQPQVLPASVVQYAAPVVINTAANQQHQSPWQMPQQQQLPQQQKPLPQQQQLPQHQMQQIPQQQYHLPQQQQLPPQQQLVLQNFLSPILQPLKSDVHLPEVNLRRLQQDADSFMGHMVVDLANSAVDKIAKKLSNIVEPKPIQVAEMNQVAKPLTVGQKVQHAFDQKANEEATFLLHKLTEKVGTDYGQNLGNMLNSFFFPKEQSQQPTNTQ